MQLQELQYVNKSKVTSSFQEICIVCIFWLLFSIHLQCQLLKGQLQPPPAPLRFLRASVPKQKLLKGCHQGQNFNVLAILGCLELSLSATTVGRQYFLVFHDPSTLKSISLALNQKCLHFQRKMEDELDRGTRLEELYKKSAFKKFVRLGGKHQLQLY